MSTTSSPIDRDVLAELRRGDERALERLFRERFTELSAEARAELDVDGSQAPRVVEDAFLSAWKARTHFETPESLKIHAVVAATNARPPMMMAIAAAGSDVRVLAVCFDGAAPASPRYFQPATNWTKPSAMPTAAAPKPKCHAVLGSIPGPVKLNSSSPMSGMYETTVPPPRK